MNKFTDIHYNYKAYKSREREIDKIYKTIKEEYIKEKNLNITLERIYLEKKLENYTGETINMYITMFISIMTTVLTLTVERALSESGNILLSILGLIVLFLAFFIFIVRKDKNIKKEINEHTYYKICLKVLDEIEKN